jgi:broad specificity phosphatase PhoE
VILFVGHAGIFRLVLSAALRIPLEATFRMEQDYCCIHVLEQRELLEEGSSPLRSRHQETEETVPAESENPAFSEKMSFRLLRLNWNATFPEA